MRLLRHKLLLPVRSANGPLVSRCVRILIQRSAEATGDCPVILLWISNYLFGLFFPFFLLYFISRRTYRFFTKIELPLGLFFPLFLSYFISRHTYRFSRVMTTQTFGQIELGLDFRYLLCVFGPVEITPE